MKLSYGDQISSLPIKLSIGKLKKPKLNDIFELSFEVFELYEAFLVMTPEIYFNNYKKDGKEYWASLTEEQKFDLNIYDLIVSDEALIKEFVDIFNFFFVERVIYVDGLFITIKNDCKYSNEEMAQLIKEEMPKEQPDEKSYDVRSYVVGVINENNFATLTSYIRQVCNIENDEENIENLKFKNDIAKALYLKMMASKKKQNKNKKKDINHTIPNIISAVCSKHPSINYTNVGELTIFQLIDCFNRLISDSYFYIDSVRVSVWGDEKKTFNYASWFKNDYDKK